MDEMVLNKTRKTLLGVIIGAVAALLALSLWMIGALERLEFVTWA